MTPFTGKRKIFIAPMILLAIAAFSYITMLLWNSLMPEIFHLTTISFWQAAGLLVLTRLLFGFNGPWGHHNHRAHHLREKWANMNPQEREEFMQRLHEQRHCWGPKRKQENQESTENKNS